MSIEKKVAIITGAGSGIGRASAKRFSKEGYRVVLVGRTLEKLQKVAEEIGNENVLTIRGDVSNQSDVDNVIASTVKAYHQIDVIVNNAAVFVAGTINDISLEDWNAQFAINTTGPFLMIKKALPFLAQTKGSIVNVSSVSGLGGDWGMFAYNATKGALNLMTKALSLDLADKGIRVNAVAPTLTSTEMTEFVVNDEQMMSLFDNRIAMKRVGEPEDIADVIAFLSSENARFITGTILPVDGGVSASSGQPKLG